MPDRPSFMNCTNAGSFTLHGGNIAPMNSQLEPPALLIDGFQGQLSFLSTMLTFNITPLLDLAFVLLVIFIITTPQLVNNLEMFLPSGKPPPPANPNAPKPKINRIVVDTPLKARANSE